MKERSMVHPEVKKLLQEVFGWFSEEEGKRAGEYPEVYLVSLLQHIQDRLPEVSAMLYSTVQMGGFGADTERFKRVLAIVKSSNNAQSRKIGKKPLKHQRLMKIAA